jgi:hypothetical protein
MLVTLLSPILEFQHAPLPPKVLQVKERALTLCSSVVFNLDSHLSPLRNLGMRHIITILMGSSLPLLNPICIWEIMHSIKLLCKHAHNKW